MTEITHRHRDLAAGRWGQLSLAEQLGNVGSEVGRMLRWQARDERLMTAAFERALELLDLTLADPRWRDRLREIARARELLCDAAAGGTEYRTTLEDLDRYFLAFAVAARSDRDRHKVDGIDEQTVGSAMKQRLDSTASLGSWAFFCDLSGRVQERFDNPIITTAAVAVPRELSGFLRTQVRRAFPGRDTKWKYGKLDAFRTASDLIVSRRLPFSVSVTHIADAAKWHGYFRDGNAFCAKAAALSGEPVGFAAPDLTLRMRFLAGAIATLIGRVLRARHSGCSQLVRLEIEVIVDTDLRNAETEAQFCESFQDWPLTSRLASELGIQPVVREARCETEEAEPLLLLPDYLAGVYHHADPRTKLGRPLVTAEEASTAVHDLRARSGGLLYEQSEDFDETYPLDHDGHGGIVRRAKDEKR